MRNYTLILLESFYMQITPQKPPGTVQVWNELSRDNPHLYSSHMLTTVISHYIKRQNNIN